MTVAAPPSPNVQVGPPGAEFQPLADSDLAQDVLNMKNLAENWDSFTPSELADIEPDPQKRLFAKRMVAPVLEALDARGKLIVEPDDHTPEPQAQRIRDQKATADGLIAEKIANCLDSERLAEYGLSPEQARSRLLGILHMGEEEDRRVMGLPVNDKAARRISHRHKGDIHRIETDMNPYAEWDEELHAAHPTRLGRAVARVKRGFITPKEEQFPYTTAVQRMGLQRTRQVRLWDNRERLRSVAHPLERRGPRQQIADNWAAIEHLMGRPLNADERAQIGVVGNSAHETKQDKEASMGQLGLSAAVERLGGPIVRWRHQIVTERSQTRREAMRMLDPEAEGRLERIDALRTLKNQVLQGWERGQPAPGHSRENLLNILNQWQDEVFSLGFAPGEVVEQLNKGFYQLDERDILANGATTEKWFVTDPEYGDRGIAYRDDDGNIEVTFADGTERIPDPSLPDDPANPLKLADRLRGDNSYFERPDLPPVVGRPDRRISTDQAEQLYSIYDQERTPQSAEVAYKACLSQAERLEARARRLNTRLGTNLDAGERAATEARLSQTIEGSRRWRLRQIELQNSMQGFREIQEPPSPQTRAGRSIVARLTGRSRSGVNRPQPIQSHTTADQDGNITWVGGEMVDASLVHNFEEIRGEITLDPRANVARYRARPTV